jgi:hypothetical protein
MALINCTECGREISNKASACPGCGAPVASPPGDVNTHGDLSITDRAVRTYAAKLAKQIGNGDGPSFVWGRGSNKIQVMLGKASPPESLPPSMSLEQWRNQLGPAIAEELSKLGWEIREGNRFWRENTRASAANVPVCPTCSSTNIEKIELSTKVGAALLVGVFALGKISKTFKCSSCGYQW